MSLCVCLREWMHAWVCVCVCVWERVKERDGTSERRHFHFLGEFPRESCHNLSVVHCIADNVNVSRWFCDWKAPLPFVRKLQCYNEEIITASPAPGCGNSCTAERSSTTVKCKLLCWVTKLLKLPQRWSSNWDTYIRKAVNLLSTNRTGANICLFFAPKV